MVRQRYREPTDGSGVPQRSFQRRSSSSLLFSAYPPQTIISSIVKDGSLKATGEYQLLLGALALPGVSDGHPPNTDPPDLRRRLPHDAAQDRPQGLDADRIRRLLGDRSCASHSTAQLTPQIIGCAYDQLANIVPLFVIFVRQPLRWPPLIRPVWPPRLVR